jgi:hypothetical protein
LDYDIELALLAVIFQDLVASGRQFRTMLLQAGQNREISLINYGPAVALDVAGAGRLFLRRAATLLLGDGHCGKGEWQKGKCPTKFLHYIPSSNARESPPPDKNTAQGPDSGCRCRKPQQLIAQKR